jgi:methionyl-tRNA formyltransferase
LLEKGEAPLIKQYDSNATYAPIIKKTDGHINWDMKSETIVNLTRALDPWPGAYALFGDKTIKIWTVQPTATDCNSAPGTVLDVEPSKGILIKTGDSAVWITELQSSGGRRMPAADFLRGSSINELQKAEHFRHC